MTHRKKKEKGFLCEDIRTLKKTLKKKSDLKSHREERAQEEQEKKEDYYCRFTKKVQKVDAKK